MSNGIYDELTKLRKGPEPQPGDLVHYVDRVNGKASNCIEARIDRHGGLENMPEPSHHRGCRTVTLRDVSGRGLVGWCNQDYMSAHPCSRPQERYWEQATDGAGRPVVESRWHWPE